MALARRLSKHLYERYEEIREDLKDMSNPYIELDIDKYMEKYDALEEKANQLEEKANHLEEQNAAMKSELVEKNSQLAALQERIRLLEQQTGSKSDQ